MLKDISSLAGIHNPEFWRTEGKVDYIIEYFLATPFLTLSLSCRIDEEREMATLKVTLLLKCNPLVSGSAMIVGFNDQCLPTFLIMFREYTSNILGTTVHSVISSAAQGVLLKPLFIFSTRKIKLCESLD